MIYKYNMSNEYNIVILNYIHNWKEKVSTHYMMNKNINFISLVLVPSSKKKCIIIK